MAKLVLSGCWIGWGAPVETLESQGFIKEDLYASKQAKIQWIIEINNKNIADISV